ncbi:MAG: M1 family aminopeptidase [Longimicrobiaceae bacterium]
MTTATPFRSAALLAAAALAACAPLPPTPPPVVEPAPIEPGVAPPPGPYAPGFDALHYDLDLTLPNTGREIEASARVYIRLTGAGADTLPLDLTGLAVSGVRVNGAAAGFRYQDGKLRVPVPETAGAGDTLLVEVGYSGTPDDGLIIGANVHGQRTVFADNWPNRARFWFPSIDHPSDKASVAFTVRTPPESGWSVIANGEGGETEEAGIWRYRTSSPIPTYTMVIGAANFEIRSLGRACGSTGAARATCPEVSWWVFPPDSAHAARVFARADEMMIFYSDLIAPYPYHKLAHVQAATRFGGMENVGAIFYSQQSISARREIEPTVAHEVAHMWFGNSVTESDWHHLWLSEGFASYFGPLFFEHADGTGRFREMMAASARAYLDSEVTGQPIVDPSEGDLFALLNRNNYQKGAWVLHMLRGLLGDDAFFRGMRRYHQRYRHGNALSDDLRREVELASGRELGWFFQQWLFEPGYPRLRVRWRWDDQSGEVVLTVEQTQPQEWPAFRFPLELAFGGADGPLRRTVEVAGKRSQTLLVPLPARPEFLAVDPDGWLLKEVEEVAEES